MRMVKGGKGREERVVGDDGGGDGELLNHDWDNEVVDDSTVVGECGKWDGTVSSLTTYLGRCFYLYAGSGKGEGGR